MHFKPVAAGETLLSSMDSELRERLTRVFNDAVAVEMESAGLAEAAAIGGVKTLTSSSRRSCTARSAAG